VGPFIVSAGSRIPNPPAAAEQAGKKRREARSEACEGLPLARDGSAARLSGTLSHYNSQNAVSWERGAGTSTIRLHCQLVSPNQNRQKHEPKRSPDFATGFCNIIEAGNKAAASRFERAILH
jgi:hypothetical protein